MDKASSKLDTMEILPIRNNLYQHKFIVPDSYHKFIIGRKGETIKRIQRDTGTYINIVKDSVDVFIRGENKEDIILAREEIDKIISKSKNQIEYTHFISVPLQTEEIRENFKKFKTSVMNDCGHVTGLKEGMFKEIGTLHLTLSMLLLIEDGDQKRAKEALHNCKKDIISPILDESGPLNIELRGLRCMNSNVTKAKILYVEAHEETGYLQEISNKIYHYMIEQGLCRKQNDTVRLHMTVVNVSNLKHENKQYYKEFFDATNILKDHEDTLFGKVNFTTLHISQKGTRTDDGYYDSIEVIDLLNC